MMGAPYDLVAARLFVATLILVAHSAIIAVAEFQQPALPRFVKRFYLFNLHLTIRTGHISQDLFAERRLWRRAGPPLDRDHFAEAELSGIVPCRRGHFVVPIAIFYRRHFRRSVRRARIFVICRGRCRHTGGVSLALPPLFPAGKLRKVAQMHPPPGRGHRGRSDPSSCSCMSYRLSPF